VRHLEVFDGAEGHSLPGCPFTLPASTSHSTPLIHDILNDGNPHIGIVTYDAELIWITSTGLPLIGHSIRVPPLRVLKKWHDGLQDASPDAELYTTGTVSSPPIASDTDFGRPNEPSVKQPDARRSLLSLRRDLLSESSTKAGQMQRSRRLLAKKSKKDAALEPPPKSLGKKRANAKTEDDDYADEPKSKLGKKAAKIVEDYDDDYDSQDEYEEGDAQDYPHEGDEVDDLVSDDEEVFDVNEGDTVQGKRPEGSAPANAGDEDTGAPPSASSPNATAEDYKVDTANPSDQDHAPLVFPEEEPELIGTPKAPKVELSHDAPLHANCQSLFKSLRGWLFGDDSDDESKMSGDNAYSSDQFRSKDAVLAHALRIQGWKTHAEHFTGAASTGNQDHPDQPSKYVLVDAHIISTPVIGDIDGDGDADIVFAVSYFFDKDHYENPEAHSKIAPDVQLHNYVACGLVAYNLRTRAMLWHIHLDLTTDLTKFRAFLYSNPVLADLDGDGKLETLVGTSVGFIYVVNSDGKVRKGFPLQMGEIQAPITVHDLNGDGQLEIIAADSRHNIAAFHSNGENLWHRHVSGFVSSGITIGDVNGDGQVDVVAATNSGQIWVLNGATGDSISNFPLKAGGPVLAPVTLAKLHDNGRSSLELVFTSHDGYVYVVDGWNGCASKYDIGEHSFGQVLIDDVDGNGKLDLVITTMNGRIIVLGTDTKYHALRTWTSEFQGRNGFAAREGAVGIYALDSTRKRGDISGQSLPFQFTIEDNTRGQGDPRHSALRDGRPYKVKIMLGTSSLLLEASYDKPGTYLVEVPCPGQRQKSVITLQMTTRNGMLYEDSFVVSFHMHFFRTLKLIILAPFLLAASVVFLVRNIKNDLPM